MTLGLKDIKKYSRKKNTIYLFLCLWKMEKVYSEMRQKLKKNTQYFSKMTLEQEINTL